MWSITLSQNVAVLPRCPFRTCSSYVGYFLEDDQSGRVLDGKVKVVTTVGLDEVKKGYRVTDFNILFLDESLN